MGTPLARWICKLTLNLWPARPSVIVMKYVYVFIAGVLCSYGCGAVSSGRLSSSDRVDLIERAEKAHKKRSPDVPQRAPRVQGRVANGGLKTGHLPRPSVDVIWGDGRGATQEDAILAGRRTVSQQLLAQVSSELKSYESSSSVGNEYVTSLYVRSRTRFDDAELIKTLGVVEHQDGYTARVGLNKRDAAEVYLKKYIALQEKMSRLAPALLRGAEAKNAAVLLNSEFSLASMMMQQRLHRRILRILGHTVEPSLPQRVAKAEKAASSVRRRSFIQLDVQGDGSKRLKRSVAGEIGRLLARRGCAFRIGAENTHSPFGAQAVAVLNIHLRNHVELGVFWRYLGFEIEFRDARSGRPFVHVNGMPELVHGGGPSWAMADQAVIRTLRTTLDESMRDAFDGVTCRSL